MREIDGTSDGSGPPVAERVVDLRLATAYGDFLAVGYRDGNGTDEQMALVYGDVTGEGALVRLHSECLTGDSFGSRHCDCGGQLSAALSTIVREGRGVLVYLRGHEGRGIGLLAKLQAMKLQADGLDTVEANLALGLPADARDYQVAAEILHDLGIRSVRLMSNNPLKREALQRHGVKVTEEVPLLITPQEENIFYLRTKRERLGHHLPHLEGGGVNTAPDTAPDTAPATAPDTAGDAESGGGGSTP